MARLLSNRRFVEVAGGVCILCCIIGFLSFPSQAAGGARDGIQLCLDIIVPSLFPFFVLSTMLVEMGCADALGFLLERIMRPVFNLSGACGTAVAMGFLGGYPVGAKTAITLYEKGLCNKTEAERLLSFSNNSGPAFILGAVGVGIFANSRAGLLLYLAHTAASLTIGFLFRYYKRNDISAPTGSYTAPARPVGMSRAFVRSVSSSLQSVLSICAFVIFFTVAVKMLFLFGVLPAVAQGLSFLFSPLGLTADSAEHLLTGLIEMTSGLWSLQGSAVSLSGQISMAAFMLGWAGVSVHCQVLSFIGESGLRTWTYIVGKMLHGVLSAVYAYCMIGLFGLREPLSTYLAEQVGALAGMDFHSTLAAALAVALFIWVAFLGITWWISSRVKRVRII